MRQHAGLALLAFLMVSLFTGCGEAFPAKSPGEKSGTKAAVRGFTTGMGERAEATVGASSGAGRTSMMSSEEAGRRQAAFVAGRRAGGGTGLEANRILAVRFGEHEDYERVVIDLGTGAEPAETVPVWTLEGPLERGVLRVTFPSVEETGVSDGPLDGSLLEDFYVVRAPEEGMFVDMYAGAAFRYRVLELSDPARLVVDIRPSGEALKSPLPARRGNTVVVEPRQRTRLGDTFTVNGYSRNPEATNTIVLTGSGGDVMARKVVQSNDWTATWGYFETTLDPAPFGKRATLRAGAPSARDGALQGVEVTVKGTKGTRTDPSGEDRKSRRVNR